MSTPPSNDSDLRRLFDDAVSDVHPEGGTSEIRARAGRPSAGRWVPLTVAAAVATVVVIVGGAWLAQQQSGDAPAAGPGGTAQEPTSQPSLGRIGARLDVPVYYVGSTAAGPRLFAETHEVTDATGQRAAGGGPGGPQRVARIDPDYQTRLPALRRHRPRIRRRVSTITIDLSGRPRGHRDMTG